MKYYVEGITTNGERLRFERWVYEMWIRHNMQDEFLITQLRRCVQFNIEY